jgi:hypothetical protein
LQGETISLLPAFLAARLSATLDEIEQVIDAVECAPSVAAAADAVRPADAEDAVTSISAARWVRRRLHPIRATLTALVTLVSELAGCAPTLAAIRGRLEVTRVLVALRKVASAHLGALAPPFGLSTRGGR